MSMRQREQSYNIVLFCFVSLEIGEPQKFRVYIYWNGVDSQGACLGMEERSKV